MKCTQCGWMNPPSYPKCYNCDHPLQAQSVSSHTPVMPRKTKKIQSDIPVAVHFPSFGMRAVAAGIDLIIMGLVGAVLAGIWYAVSSGMSADVQVIGFLIASLVAIFIPGVMDAYSASPGKRTTEMMVVTQRGKRPGVIRGVLRHVLRFVFHFTFPFVLAFLERMLFGQRGLHNIVMGCYVVSAGAPEAEIRMLIARDPTNGATKAVGTVLAVVLMGLISIVGLGAVLSANEEPNPTREALKIVVADTKPITGHVSDYIEQMQHFPESTDALGLPQLPPGIASITMHADNASIHAVLDGSVAAGLQGKTIIWQTELKMRGGALRASRWRCGSIDITRDDLPYLCRSDVGAKPLP